jgi:predicted  nucleic acid-binding Zn-ribbon protein
LYRVKKEVEEGHRGQTTKARPVAVPETEQSKAERKARNRKIFDLKTQIQSLDRQLVKYGDKKKQVEEQLHAITDKQETDRLKAEHIALVEKLAGIEERWLALTQELEKTEAQ